MCKVVITTPSVLTLKAALCHMTNAQLRDAEEGLPVASLLATIAVSSNPDRNSHFYPPFRTKSLEGDILQAMEKMQRMWSSFVSPDITSFWLDVNVIVCS